MPREPTLRLEDLSPYGLILPPKRLTTWRLVDLVFQQRRVPYTVALEVGGWEVIKQYVAMGLGISIVTGICLTEADQERLEVRNLSEYFPPRSYGVVVRKGKFLSPQARAFADLVKPGCSNAATTSSQATPSADPSFRFVADCRKLVRGHRERGLLGCRHTKHPVL